MLWAKGGSPPWRHKILNPHTSIQQDENLKQNGCDKPQAIYLRPGWDIHKSMSILNFLSHIFLPMKMEENKTMKTI